MDAVKHVAAAGGESAADAGGGGCRGVGLGSGEAPLDAVPAGEAPALFTLDVEGDAAEVLAAVSANLTLAAPGLMAW
ncbi:hypothetical protein CKO31_21465 [Thiohalocapsa halophila]|uniref:Uncharacterized protein n=1 Tax=Thiohalocapsa halophila TaxID=69359 RepID=A0ABS1CMV8_9GAMM|nr:hypothetical protein [Thiohalocapsa halophila]